MVNDIYPNGNTAGMAKEFNPNRSDGPFVTHIGSGNPYDVTQNYTLSDMLPFTYDDLYEYPPDVEVGYETVRTNKFLPGINNGWDFGNGVWGNNLGNFGVTAKYNFEIYNAAAEDKQFVYSMFTATNYIVRLSHYVWDDNQNGYVKEYFPLYNGHTAVARNETEHDLNGTRTQRGEVIDIVKYPLPANTTSQFTLEVTSPTNVAGGLQNAFSIEPAW